MKWYHNGLQNRYSGFEPLRPCHKPISRYRLVFLFGIRYTAEHMKKILILLIGAAIGAAIVYYGLMPKTSTETSLATGAIEYNCKLSSGTFKDGDCACPEEQQLNVDMYDEATGFCQSAHGGPAGDAFNASIGLPYGAYGYYQNIILDLCEGSGGSLSGAACICPAGEAYEKSTGQCTN